MNAHPEAEGAVDGIGPLVVDAQRGVDDIAVDHGRQSAVGSDGGEVVDRGRQAQAADMARVQGHVPTHGEIVEIEIVAAFKPVVGGALVFDVHGRSLLHDVVVGKARHVHIGQRRAVVDLVSEGSVHLQRDVEVLVAETDVGAERPFRCSLSGDVSVTAVLDVDASVVVEILNVIHIGSVLVLYQPFTVWQVEHADGLSDNLVDDIVLATVESGAT